VPIAETLIIMAVITELLSAFAVMYPLLAGTALAGSIADIEHVVLFMQGTNILPQCHDFLLISA
jgi:phospholipase C